ncbi:MAG: hypothetical protein PWP69_2177 [Enterococcus sp.]|nr:hypothetical protein [Enterococcus sp.]
MRYTLLLGAYRHSHLDRCLKYYSKLHLTKNRLKIFQAVRYIIYLLLRQFQQ